MIKNEKFSVLLLDDDICFTTIITKALRNNLPNTEVLVARSIAEAQLLLAEFKIHFFILDVNLPDGTGIDFLCDVRTMFPDARVMMVTATAMPDLQQRSDELGVLLFREKPVDIKEILQLVRTHCGNVESGTAHLSADGQYAVSLTCLSAMDVIQLKCLTSATLALQFASTQGIGRIFFENGAIVHAETPDLSGEGAFEQIVRWKGGRIKELTSYPKPPHTITVGWQGLLLHVAQRIDEAALSAPTH